jgi:hypothetical protein
MKINHGKSVIKNRTERQDETYPFNVPYLVPVVMSHFGVLFISVVLHEKWEQLFSRENRNLKSQNTIFCPGFSLHHFCFQDGRPHVSSVVSLFLLAQVFLIMHHAPLVRQLADIIFNGDLAVSMQDPTEPSATTSDVHVQVSKEFTSCIKY